MDLKLKKIKQEAAKMTDNELIGEFKKVNEELISIGNEVKIGFDHVNREIELVLTTINNFSTNMDKRMNSMDTRLKNVEEKMLTKQYMKEYIDDKFSAFARTNKLQVRDQDDQEYKP